MTFLIGGNHHHQQRYHHRDVENDIGTLFLSTSSQSSVDIRSSPTFHRIA